MSFDPQVLQQAPLLAFILVFLGGVITSIGPCNMASIPLIVGFVGGSTNLSRPRSFTLSLAFAIGLAITFMLLGIFASLVVRLIGGASFWYYLVAGFCFVIGLQMMGILNIHLPMWFGGLRERVGLKGIPGALALGLVSGLVASQCATPVLAAILTYVMSQDGNLPYGAALLFIYVLGRGVPVVLAGTFTGALKRMQSLDRWSAAIERAGGLIVIAVGFYFLWIA